MQPNACLHGPTRRNRRFKENDMDFAIPGVGILAVFSYLAVDTWLENRRKEREALYRRDALQKIAETQGGAAALEYLREEERNAQRRRRERLKLGGLITTAAGIGIGVFLYAVLPDRPIYFAGLIPVLIGLALLFSEELLSPKA
jgi:hypothetical protein